MGRGRNLFDVIFKLQNYGVEAHVTRKRWLRYPGTYMRIRSVTPNPRDGMRGDVAGQLYFRGMLGRDNNSPKRIRSALKKEWVLLWDSSRDELVVPAALKAQPQDVVDAWEKLYFEPARAASMRLRASNTPAAASSIAGKGATRVGSSVSLAEELATARTGAAGEVERA